MTVAAGFPTILIRRLQRQLRSLESVATHPGGGLLFYWGGPPIEVEILQPLTTFSWLLSLLLKAIGNTRQSLQNPPRTTPRLEEFSLLVLVLSLRGTKHYGTWCRNKLLISKTFSLVSYRVSSNCCFCWAKQLEYSCSSPWDGDISNLRNHPIARQLPCSTSGGKR